MLIQHLISLTLFVVSVLSSTTFIENGKRAEIFELTDNEVGTFRVILPDEEFALLKEKAILVDYALGEFKDDFEKCQMVIQQITESLTHCNFTEAYPTDNVAEKLPSLKIGTAGLPTFDVDEIMEGFDFDKDHYHLKHNSFFDNALLHVIQKNKEFDLLKILTTLAGLTLTHEEALDPFLAYMLQELDETHSEEENIQNLEINLNTYISEFKTKNATMSFEVLGLKKDFNKITFSLGGKYSRFFSKPGFNLKIRGNKDLFGRKQFKLRSDCIEPTFLRTKLISDIHNRLGLPSISANYVTLYINDEYFGLYILTDAYKLSWVEYVYGEKDTTTLYKCLNTEGDLSLDTANGCVNENEEVTDFSEWTNFLTTLDQANQISDLEDILDVDEFLTEMVLEYLLDSWDHIQNGHNYYMFKPQNGKWLYLSHDFDLDFGQDYNDPSNSYISDEVGIHIIDVLLSSNSTRFNQILVDVVSKVFNPMVLYPRIDELKEFIRPYIELEKIPNEQGIYPGRINTAAEDFFSLEEWEANVEFTSVKTKDSKSFGLKYWILGMYRFVCEHYDMECDETYLDDDYEYEVNTDVEYIDDYEDYDDFYFDDPTDLETDIDENDEEIPTEIPSDGTNDEEGEAENEEPLPTDTEVEEDITGALTDAEDSEADVLEDADDHEESEMEVEVDVDNTLTEAEDSEVDVLEDVDEDNVSEVEVINNTLEDVEDSEYEN